MDYFVVHILVFSCFLPQHASLSAQETEVAHVASSKLRDWWHNSTVVTQ